MSEEKPQRRHRRDATATRAAILEAARNAFASQGYESVGVREIAAAAGVDAALVIRYFGSKEGLFTEAFSHGFDLNVLLMGDRSTLGERLAYYILQKNEEQAQLDPLLALLRSPASEQAQALRQAIDEEFIGPLAHWLGGEKAVQRASIIAAYLLGILVTRDVIRSQQFADSDIQTLVALIAPTLQSYIDNPPD